MALPTIDEIARLGQTETLPDIIFSARFPCDFSEQETFARLLAQMHNDGLVDLLAPLDEALVQKYPGIAASMVCKFLSGFWANSTSQRYTS
ncbi:hypothetical protein HG619_06230 [Pseudomonas syringae]|nr:hypothetical protein [Pseudomonas syringae]